MLCVVYLGKGFYWRNYTTMDIKKRELEEEQNVRSKEDEDALDGHLLASRDTRLADSDDEAIAGISDTLPPKDIVGSKARLLALMNKNIEPSDEEDDPDADPDADPEADADADPEADTNNTPTNSKTTKAQRKPRAASKAKKTAKTTTVKRGPGRIRKRNRCQEKAFRDRHRTRIVLLKFYMTNQ